jgi:ankyrin repeat protein
MRARLVNGLLMSLLGALCLSALVEAAGTAPVADAAMQGDIQAVRALLKNAADVNAAQGDGMTALHWAATRGDAELAQLLLYAGANVRAVTRIGAYSSVFLAAKNGQSAVLETLLNAGGDPKATTANGTTPLMAASASGDLQTVALLLDKGADVNAVEPVRGNTALMFAAANSRPGVIELLAARGADLKATTKVVDLSSLTRERLGFTGGNPPVPGQEGQQGNNRQPPSEAQRGGTPETPAGQASARPREGAGPPPAANTGNAAGRQAGQAGTETRRPQVAGIDRQFQLNELVVAQGGLTPLLYAARQGYTESAEALIKAGADVNQLSAGDRTSPLLMAVINGHFDLAQMLLEKGADPNIASDNGAAALYGVVNVQWAPKALYPQPRAYQQQNLSYLDMMKALLDKGADPNTRLKKKVWYSGYSFDLSGVDEIGATPFWRAAYASDVDAMRLLVARGADPNIPTMKPAGRPRTGDSERDVQDVSTTPPLPLGGPSVTALQAAAGVGYGEGFAANAHRFAPVGMLAAVKYLVEELHADVNAADHEGNTALHHAASRGDTEMITYLVSKGADVKVVNREGKTTADMANGPVQRTQPYPEALALLEKLGAVNNHKCVSC